MGVCVGVWGCGGVCVRVCVWCVGVWVCGCVGVWVWMVTKILLQNQPILPDQTHDEQDQTTNHSTRASPTIPVHGWCGMVGSSSTPATHSSPLLGGIIIICYCTIYLLK